MHPQQYKRGQNVTFQATCDSWSPILQSFRRENLPTAEPVRQIKAKTPIGTKLRGNGGGEPCGKLSAPVGVAQPIAETPAHLMHCGLPAGIGRQTTQVPWILAHYSECRPIGCIVSLPDTCGLADFERLEFVSARATDTYLVNDDPSRGPGMPECFLVSDTYRAASTTCLTHLAC
ncbi:hypothetical protein EYF80_006175 [Liparis tanakae]|uniref:Uncharacterized protein n=1 Tax=Liparis tanakae TaxID=230148 RepID=A0A4Z2J0U7_9TELE|nr:hypothetical protein EYF80_006175 [Liparis tanakae]